jgi:hypothetical protein
VKYAREILVEADRDVRVGLVVARPDEPRLVLLDEVLLGQRLDLGDHHQRLDVVDLLVSAVVP